MRLSELMGSEYSGRNHSFPIKSTSWSRSLQQLKVTGLSTRERNSSGSRDGAHTAQGQPKPHLNRHFLLSQSFLTHFQLTKLFPWEQKRIPVTVDTSRGFLALEALEVRIECSSYHQLHQALLNCPHHNSPLVLLRGTAWDKASPAPSGCTNPFSGWPTAVLGLVAEWKENSHLV